MQQAIVVTFFCCLFLCSAAQKQDDFKNIDSKIPVTHKSFNDPADKLQFAIVSDLWGGNRPGVFEDAVDKLNLLQPQFVISVGDLIDGKTHDTTQIGMQWKEFAAKVGELSMPFFYVPGNHDIGNADMQKEWNRRLGKDYYHFVYKSALFLIVNTQDGGGSGVKQEQVNYFRKVIRENSGVRWTFVFMHRPVWQGEDQKEEGYEKIEEALKDRNYTLFSGHHHTYRYTVKNGRKHFVLGTTGGGIELRGEKFGEYDHVTMVSLKGEEVPKIVNLKLDGIIKEDVVNEKTFPLTQTLINENWMSAPVTVWPNQFEKSLSPQIVFSNPTSTPLTVKGNFPQVNGYRIAPAALNLVLPPGSKQTQPVSISSADGSDIDIASLPSIDVELDGAYNLGPDTFRLPSKKRLLFDWRHELPLISNAAKIANDQFENFDSAGFTLVAQPELINKWYWYGLQDCRIQFRMIRDAKTLFITAFVKDDQLVTGPKQDVLYIDLEDKNGVAARLSVEPSFEQSTPGVSGKSSLEAKDLALKTKINPDGNLRFLIQVPIEKIAKKDQSFRFNIGYRDQDNKPDVENSTLFWKPLWGSADDYKNSGTFLLK